MIGKNMTIHEISALRGQLKAKKRGVALVKRTAKVQADAERRYQEKLARDIQHNI